MNPYYMRSMLRIQNNFLGCLLVHSMYQSLQHLSTSMNNMPSRGEDTDVSEMVVMTGKIIRAGKQILQTYLLPYFGESHDIVLILKY